METTVSEAQTCAGCIWLHTSSGKGTLACQDEPVRRKFPKITPESKACKLYTSDTPQFAAVAALLLDADRDTLAKVGRSLRLYTEALEKVHLDVAVGDVVTFELTEGTTTRQVKAKVFAVTQKVARVIDLDENSSGAPITVGLDNSSLQVVKKVVATQPA